MRNKILLIDCFDSFTYNLKHYLEQFIFTDVIRIDNINLDDISQYSAIVLSPGPKLPQDYPLLRQIIEKYYQHKPILGVCLGMQALGEFFGGNLHKLQDVKHGLSEPLFNIDSKHFIYQNLDQNICVARYHSWVVRSTPILNKHFIFSAFDSNNELMSFYHKKHHITGVQFHPESIMTPDGLQMIKNWCLSLNL